jgi:2-oxoglutarate dehydrogenase complex dehydrogenase (E1) component-like enzyme
MDEPSFTQPTMYSGIVSRERVPDLYFTAVSEQGVDTTDIVSELETYKDFLSEESKNAENYEAEATHLSKQWTGIEPAQKGVVAHFDTGICLRGDWALVSSLLVVQSKKITVIP